MGLKKSSNHQVACMKNMEVICRHRVEYENVGDFCGKEATNSLLSMRQV